MYTGVLYSLQHIWYLGISGEDVRGRQTLSPRRGVSLYVISEGLKLYNEIMSVAGGDRTGMITLKQYPEPESLPAQPPWQPQSQLKLSDLTPYVTVIVRI